MLDGLFGHLGVVGVAQVEGPAVVGVVLAVLGVELERLPEEPQGGLVGPLAQRGLALLEVALGREGALALLAQRRLAVGPLALEDVLLAPPGIAERLVGLLDVAEDLSGELPHGVARGVHAVRMGPLRELLICRLDLLLARRLRHAQDLEVVLLGELLGQGGELGALRVVLGPRGRRCLWRGRGHRGLPRGRHRRPSLAVVAAQLQDSRHHEAVEGATQVFVDPEELLQATRALEALDPAPLPGIQIDLLEAIEGLLAPRDDHALLRL